MPTQRTALQRVERARNRLLLGKHAEAFGYPSMMLEVAEDPSVGAMVTDGTTLKFNSEWVGKQTDEALMGDFAKLVYQCMLGHPWRGSGNDWDLWNDASDYATNQDLIDAGFILSDPKVSQSFAGKAAEQIYGILEAGRRQQGQQPSSGNGQQDQQQQNGQGNGQGDGQKPRPSFAKAKDQDGQGDQPGQDQQQQGNSELDWQRATARATAEAIAAGTLPGAMLREIQRRRRADTIDWITQTRDWLEHVCPHDYSWTHPNRRLISQDIYLPGMIRESLPWLAFFIDTSDSVTQKFLDAFAEEARALLDEAKPELLRVIYVDRIIQGEEQFGPGDDLVLHAKGGGGTAFQPAFDYVDDDPPVGAIYCTDLEGAMPKDPGYAVLWVLPAKTTRRAPFGEHILINV